MRQPPTDICPLLAIASIGRTGGGQPVCIEGRCAWFRVDYDPENGSSTGKCAVERIAAALTRGKDTIPVAPTRTEKIGAAEAAPCGGMCCCQSHSTTGRLKTQ